jgi:glycerol-3-phosphate acyltransferase PlsY
VPKDWIRLAVAEAIGTFALVFVGVLAVTIGFDGSLVGAAFAYGLTVAVMIAGYYGGANAAMLAALGAFLGHLFPVWLKFNGGKGVATYIGVLIGLFWPAALTFCLIWLAIAFTTRYSSLAALIAAFVTPLFLWWFGHPALASLFVVLTLLLFWKHTENIKRLQSGTEGRIDAK